MARDRLAALRAQQAAARDSTGNGEWSPSRATFAANQDVNVPSSPGNGQQQQSYEMPPLNGQQNVGGGVAPAAVDGMGAFYEEVSNILDKIQLFSSNVDNISRLHSRSINNTDSTAASQLSTELQQLVEDTNAIGEDVRNRITQLAKQPASGRELQVRQQQISLLRSKFLEALQNYQTVEQQYRARYRERIERQLRIVKPDATAEEVRSATEDLSGTQIFSQALLNSNRYNESRSAFREVQERHEDIKRIEQTLAELAQLFNDMSLLTEQQQEVIDNVEKTAGDVENNTEAALGQVVKAKEHAAAARRKRWICFFIIVIILAAIGIGLGVHFGTGGGGGSSNNNNNSSGSG